MRNKNKLKIIILILGIIFAISTISNYNFSDDQENIDDSVEIRDETNLKSPKKSWFNNSMDPIFIDNGASNNWDWARTQEWCRLGDGSWGDPYVIENVTIDADSTGSGILIENSKNVYFIINNCTVYNSGSDAYDAGIKLENTNNGTLTNNNCSNNREDGIVLYNNCDNNTISGNTANDNDVDGIMISANGCDNNISGNTANNNDYSGIYLNDCDWNTISGNTANDNADYGIGLVLGCCNNTISGNIICNNITINQDRGISLDSSDYNNITENIIYYNNIYGIFLSGFCDNNLIHFNFLGGNGDNARDVGNNQWDNATIGNYWDDYSGYDILPVDGIGDSPYSLPVDKSDKKPIMYNFKDTDGDSFSDGVELSHATNPLESLWYPMPNLNVSHFSSVVTYKMTSFMIDFSIRNNGIWKAEGVIVIVKCEELDLTLFNNTDSPFNLDVDDIVYISVNCPPIGQTGTFTLNITIDPNNLIAETYSAKDGSLRSDWEGDNSLQASLSIISTSSQTIIVGDDDDDDDDDDEELVSTSIITASIVIAVTGGVIAMAIILHALLMKKRLVTETPIPSKKKQPIKKLK